MEFPVATWSTLGIGAAISFSIVAYFMLVATHRLYFSRYAKFPGPKLAALTYGYMFYYDVIAGKGQYMYKIQQLHEEYNSPIIRISPHELHINDPDFYDTLFAPHHSKRDKPATWSHAFGNIESVFGTISHDKHRVRRAALSPFFTPSSLRKVEPLVQENITRLVSVFRTYQKSGRPVPLKPAFAALTSDIIAEYCFGASDNYIEAEGFNVEVLEATDALTENMHITVQFQWLPRLMDKLPDKIVEWIVGRGMGKLNELKRICVRKIRECMESSGDYKDVEHRTIFHDLLESSTLPPKDKTVDRLWQEAQLLLAAGTLTTATTIASALVYLLLDPLRLQILLEELETAIPDVAKPRTQKDLEKLPYFNAVMQETLRLVSGISFRLARCSPTETLHLGDWTIPPNTALSMHQPLIHHSPTLFPSPWSFHPERWLSPTHPLSQPQIPAANPKYLIPFSKGPRSCVGRPLADAETYLTLATILRTFCSLEKSGSGEVVGVSGMKLWETDRRDVDMRCDMGLPSPEPGRGNIMIILE